MKLVTKILAVACLLGFAAAASAEEKVVWSPKDSIGKSQTWKTKATADVADGVLKIKFTDSEWSGIGLNWEGYWPEDAGVKAADYQYLVVELKCDSGSANIQLSLKDNKHKPSASVDLKKYCPDNTLPVDFQAIKIPISDLTGDKCTFVTGVVWEVMLGIWTQEAKNVDMSIRKVSFTKD